MDNDVYREKLAKIIVCHVLPLLLVEYEGVRDVHTYLNPDVKHINKTHVRPTCLNFTKRTRVGQRSC